MKDKEKLYEAEIQLLKSRIRLVLSILNLVCFLVGMIGVWITTHSYTTLWWTFVASLHFTFNK